MTTYTVKAGKHKFQPWPLVPKYQTRPGKLHFELIFDESCLHPPIDEERDWNKAIGRAFDPINPHANSALVAWRPNIEATRIEIADYWHTGGETIWRREPVLIVEPGERVKGYIDHSFKRKKGYIQFEGQKVRQEQFNAMSCVTFLLMPWFGGTNPAVHDMSLKLNYW